MNIFLLFLLKLAYINTLISTLLFTYKIEWYSLQISQPYSTIKTNIYVLCQQNFESNINNYHRCINTLTKYCLDEPSNITHINVYSDESVHIGSYSCHEVNLTNEQNNYNKIENLFNNRLIGIT